MHGYEDAHARGYEDVHEHEDEDVHEDEGARTDQVVLTRGSKLRGQSILLRGRTSR